MIKWYCTDCDVYFYYGKDPHQMTVSCPECGEYQYTVAVGKMENNLPEFPFEYPEPTGDKVR